MKNPFFRFDPSLIFLPLLFWNTNPSDLLIFLFSILIHECGHIFTIRFFGYRMKDFSLSLAGAKIRLADPYIPYKKEILIFLSGPMANLLACATATFLLRYHFTRMGVLFFFCNLLLALFNLLPLPGLDGEGALFAFLSLFLSPEKRDVRMKKVRFLFLLFLFLLSFYLLINGKNPSLLILSCGLTKEEGRKKRKKATKIS